MELFTIEKISSVYGVNVQEKIIDEKVCIWTMSFI